jgi:predicted MPP superfamily phosphohydrolase
MVGLSLKKLAMSNRVGCSETLYHSYNVFEQLPYNKGLAEYKETYMYVSQGAATFMPRMRLGTNNEINFITLEAKK